MRKHQMYSMSTNRIIQTILLHFFLSFTSERFGHLPLALRELFQVCGLEVVRGDLEKPLGFDLHHLPAQQVIIKQSQTLW